MAKILTENGEPGQSIWADPVVVVGLGDSTSGQQTKARSLPVTLASDEGPVAVIGKSAQVSASVTRLANTTQYAINDVLSDHATTPTLLTFSGGARIDGALAYVVGGTMVTSTVAATAAQVRLMLFSTPPAAENDNAAFTPTDADALKCVGWLTFDTYQDGALNRLYVARLEGQPPQFDCAATADDIYAIPVMQNAYTPGSAEVFTFTLHISQD